ncbi:MAG: S8 family serine peptidase [Anaerolineales bacterium]|nr:S8 family serine peptidase [Anaerolineales bacterium]
MDFKFIAIRRTPRTTQPVRAETLEEARAELVDHARSAPMAEPLAALGFEVLDPCAEVANGDDSFWPLCYLDAYVVETSDIEKAKRARSLLEPDYLVVPNFELSLPTPERGRMYARLPARRREWPEVSGVALARSLGITGKGVRVCVLDTGIDADHTEFRGKVVDFRYIPLDPKRSTIRNCRGFDVDGHGTHVCGILAGRNLGVAPDVELNVAAVLESETLKTSLERVVVALNWVLSMFEVKANRDKPVIVNMSLGFMQSSLDRAGFESAVLAFQQVLGTLVNDFNVLPIVAVGNEGPGLMRAPAYFSDTLSVGAVNYDLEVAEFSGGGVSPITQEVEPNVAGYGVDILSSFERNRYNRSLYRVMSGTSMAAPYATGIAALYASQNSQWQGKALWQRLVQSALPVGAPEDRAGAGLARFVQEADDA